MSCCFCFAFRRGLRPGCGLANRASKPPFSTARRHRFTEETEAPTSSATSSTSLPSCNNRSANSRRACSSAALPFGLISYHTHDPCGWFIDYVGVNNAGKLYAKGGAGGDLGQHYAGGSGSGGLIYFDPTTIINTGTITVAGGGDDTTLLGLIGLDPGVSISGSGTVVGTVTVVPEPSAFALAIAGFLGAVIFGLHRRKLAPVY